jgi:hypothetical protein
VNPRGERGRSRLRRTAVPVVGRTWFWYERIGASVVARGEGASICVGCHSGAPRDHAFTPSPR